MPINAKRLLDLRLMRAAFCGLRMSWKKGTETMQWWGIRCPHQGTKNDAICYNVGRGGASAPFIPKPHAGSETRRVVSAGGTAATTKYVTGNRSRQDATRSHLPRQISLFSFSNLIS